MLTEPSLFPEPDSVWITSAADRWDRLLSGAPCTPLLSLAMRRAIGHLAPVLRRGGHIVDVGCGAGRKSEALRQLGARVTGIDVNAELIERARQEFPECEFVLGSLETTELPAASFDALFCCSVFQYVPWESSAAACARLLEPNGRAVFLENMAGNPMTHAYRSAARLFPPLTRRYDTVIKHLDLGSARDLFTTYFAEVDIHEYNVTTPLAYLLNARAAPRVESTPRVLARMVERWAEADSALLARIPSLRQACWHALICAAHPSGSRTSS